MTFFLALASAHPHHDPRHVTDEHPAEVLVPEVVLPTTTVEDETDTVHQAQVRHHIYMPLPANYYNQPSATPPQAVGPTPIIQYVPVYTADPRFISLKLGANANLGFLRF